ncbi:FxLD family lanthipeptide [Streptomyces sp. NBC_01201]|uniref:FxLD family lanthipeptide n=1 Tax=Streptomyces sp. NBC_01201 TaxID=2903770 RepID=UPI002E0D12B6|nr:FxLD family lanthipeptide [Streptomyces sp. NBC_01201]
MTEQLASTAAAKAGQDPFDLDVTVIESGGMVVTSIASDGGCGSTCGGNAFISSGS